MLQSGDDPIYYADRKCTSKPETDPPPDGEIKQIDIGELELDDVQYTDITAYIQRSIRHLGNDND